MDFTEPVAAARLAADHIRTELLEPAGISRIDEALVLGSGWNQGVDQLGEHVATVALDSVPGFSKPLVAGHGGSLRIARTPNQKVAMVLTGRRHFRH